MTHNDIPDDAIPDWFLEAARIMQDTDCSVRNIDTELRQAMSLDDMDPRLIGEMQNVRDALGTVKVSLSVFEMIADKVIDGLTESESSDLRQADAG
jgi:hypothetical protein